MSMSRMPQAVAAEVLDRADGMCEAVVAGVCTGGAEQIHHRQMRSQGGEHTVENCGVVCNRCHMFFHKHPAWSYAAGWLVHGWDEPSWPPVFYRGVMRDREGEP